MGGKPKTEVHSSLPRQRKRSQLLPNVICFLTISRPKARLRPARSLWEQRSHAPALFQSGFRTLSVDSSPSSSLASTSCYVRLRRRSLHRRSALQIDVTCHGNRPTLTNSCENALFTARRYSRVAAASWSITTPPISTRTSRVSRCPEQFLVNADMVKDYLRKERGNYPCFLLPITQSGPRL
jgi:hypothetical protein